MTKQVITECGRPDCGKLFHYPKNPKGGRPRKYCSPRCYRFSLAAAQARYAARKKRQEIVKYSIY